MPTKEAALKGRDIQLCFLISPGHCARVGEVRNTSSQGLAVIYNLENPYKVLNKRCHRSMLSSYKKEDLLPPWLKAILWMVCILSQRTAHP